MEDCNPDIDPGDVWLLEQAQLVVGRLELLSADSIWARRSSGVRGNLLRELSDYTGQSGCALQPQQRQRLLGLLQSGYEYLEKGAREKLGAKQRRR